MNKIYIYNFTQAKFFLQNGIYPIDSGYGKKGDPYLIFIKDSKYKEVFNRWCLLGKLK